MRARRDNIVTSFCEGVTSRCEPATRCTSSRAIKDLGEAMASAPGWQPTGGSSSGAGVSPVFWASVAVLVALAACGDDALPPRPAEPVAPLAARIAADPAQGMTTELDGAAPAFSDGVLRELTGDDSAARAAFERVLADPGVAPSITARAALHLAQLEARSGQRRRALDLIARAAALAPSDVSVAEGVAQLQGDIGGSEGEVRGPRLGTPLAGVEPKVAEAFAAAERSFGEVHKLHPRAYIEALSSSINYKEDATEDAVQKYRIVAEAGGIAQIASDYRAGSLYHDLALGLFFDLPAELDPNVAANLRRTLRGRALAYLHKAVAAYTACLAGPVLAEAGLWRIAAERDLRGAKDVLGEAGEGHP